MKSQQMVRAQGFVKTICEVSEAVYDELGGKEEITVERQAILLARIFNIETSAKMARELITESMRGALKEEVEKGGTK